MEDKEKIENEIENSKNTHFAFNFKRVLYYTFYIVILGYKFVKMLIDFWKTR